MRVVLDYELLRDSLTAWRDAIVMTAGEPLAPRGAQNLAELERVLSGAVQKVDGCLAVLTLCTVDEADREIFESLVGELRAFRAWLQQGLSAIHVMERAPRA